MADGMLKDAWNYSVEEFKDLWSLVRDFILMEVMDDSGRSQGHAILRMHQPYQADEHGAFGLGAYVGCSDPYYQYWAEHDMKPGTYHHFCRASSLKACKTKVGKDSIVHVRRWVPVTLKEAEGCFRDWGLSPTLLKRKHKEKIDVGLALAPTGSGSRTASKSAPPLPPATIGDPGDRARDERRDERGREGRREGQGDRRRRRRRDSRSDTSDGGGGRRRRGMASPVRLTGDPPGRERRPARKGGKADAAALDAMLDETPDDRELQELERVVDSRMAGLKTALEKKKAAHRKDEPGEILAARAAEVAEQAKKKKRKAQDPMDALRRVLSKKKPVKEEVDFGDEDSEESAELGSEDEVEDLGADLGGKKSAASKQRRLRLLSQKKPGHLMKLGYGTMHDHVGTHFGGGEKSAGNLSPVALRYLLTFAMPQFSGGVSHNRYRELRTLATALDHIVVGRTGEAGDLLLQRFKSILMSIRDGTDQASKWLELLPLDEAPTVASSQEDYLARQMAVQQSKSDALLQRVSGKS